MNHSPEFLKLCEGARTRIRELTPENVFHKQSTHEPFEFIDVREDHEWENGHAAGARHLGRGILERDIENLIPNRQQCIVLYCGGGYRSALAADNLQKMGYTNVWSMAGGYKGWQALMTSFDSTVEK